MFPGEFSLGKTVPAENFHGMGFPTSQSVQPFVPHVEGGRGTWGAGEHPPASAAFAFGPWPGLEPQGGAVPPARPVSCACCAAGELPRKGAFCFHFLFERSSMNYLPHSIIRDVIAAVWTNSSFVCEISCRYARCL